MRAIMAHTLQHDAAVNQDDGGMNIGRLNGACNEITTSREKAEC